MECLGAGKRAEAIALFTGDVKKGAGLMAAAMEKLVADKQAKLKTALAENAKAALTAQIEMIAFLFVSFVASVGIGLWMARSITTPLNQAVALTKRIAAGDLTVKVASDSHDETGELLAAIADMVDNLRHKVTRTVEISAGIATTSNQLSATSQQIATGADQVAQQAGTMASASQEMSCTSSDIARNCSIVAEASNHSIEAAKAGEAVVQETIDGMNVIADRVRQTSITIEALGSRSEEIGNIIGTIEDIADQTNLLALNAAIEAARAGEQGRGFAVVADEVRALAERTTKATREIGEMIKAIQTETREAVKAMEEGVREVEKGAVSSQKSGHALEKILSRISEVSLQISQIATAAEEQNATTSEVTRNVEQISDVVSQTARGAEQTAIAAEQLTNQSQELRTLVSDFSLA
jgi:methyl-accepting chemotaxis protein